MPLGKDTQRRTIVVAVIRNHRGHYLLCRMAPDRGVFPGQWGLVGGGIEDGETMEEALRREVSEEVGLQLATIRPLFFKDAVEEKQMPDGSRRRVYMIYLLFECQAEDGPVALNTEFDASVWAPQNELGTHNLNRATRETFATLGVLSE